MSTVCQTSTEKSLFCWWENLTAAGTTFVKRLLNIFLRLNNHPICYQLWTTFILYLNSTSYLNIFDGMPYYVCILSGCVALKQLKTQFYKKTHNLIMSIFYFIIPTMVRSVKFYPQFHIASSHVPLFRDPTWFSVRWRCGVQFYWI